MSKSHTGKTVPHEQVIRMMKTREANGHSPNTKNRSWKAGRAPDLGDTYFRSSWERNYARYLNFLIEQGEVQSWEFEVDTFYFEGIKRGTVSYKPDFKVITREGDVEYHEVKGWMDAKSKTKIKRMAKYHPDVTLIVIDAPAYKGIQKTASAFLPHWE